MGLENAQLVTLQRSCQACAKNKRRCDKRWPRCSRCLARRVNCEYVNIPLTAEAGPRPAKKNMSAARVIPHVDPLADAPLRLEIAKEYDPLVLQFLVNGMREQPIAFAQSQKTVFIHPDLYISGLPDSIQEVYGLCRLHAKATQKRNTSSLRPLLCQKSADLYRQLSHAATFEELLGCSQALILIKAMIILGEDDDQTPYSEAVSYMLAEIAGRLWHQAPIQLPQNLSPRHAWILAESVRRTIIMAFLLRSVYSLKTRKYSVRTPFVDALPFDVRTYLWDEGTEQTWLGDVPESPHSMMSLHEFASGVDAGRVHDISCLSRLIFASCKSKIPSTITFPPVKPYIDS